MKCGAAHTAVEQQFQYTEPQICKNPQCKNNNDFRILLEKCAFVDWQRLRVQENADEIPPGSMPRCVDVICRNEIVELAKAGDKVILTGTVAVIPDTSGLARVGEHTVSGKMSGRGDSQWGDGVQGLRRLGVKEMTYKILFIASSVQHADQRTGQAVHGSNTNSSGSGSGGNNNSASATSSTFIIPTAGDAGGADGSGNSDYDAPDGGLHLSDAERSDIQ